MNIDYLKNNWEWKLPQKVPQKPSLQEELTKRYKNTEIGCPTCGKLAIFEWVTVEGEIYWTCHSHKETFKHNPEKLDNSTEMSLEVIVTEIPTKDRRELFMRAVYLNAGYSKDLMTKIGAVLVKDGNIISCGFNGFPRKVKDYDFRWENRELKHLFVAHAEFNSILSAARQGIATLGATLYTQGIPCNECMKSCIQGGISKIVVHKQWPNLVHSEKWVKSTEISNLMMEEAGIEVEWFDQKLGMAGFLDGKEVLV